MTAEVESWLLDSDPSIRWQVMQYLTDVAPEIVEAERSRVATEGWGARLLSLQASDGQWGRDTYFPWWTSTTYTLLLLRDLGVDPLYETVRAAVELVRDKVRFQWTEKDTRPFFEGEIETCINGMVVALGSYFGEPSQTLVDRLLGEQLEDGGWNCWAGEAWPDEETDRSSFNTTISVLEGLLEYEWAVGPEAAVTDARHKAENHLLDRRLFRRLSTGEVIRPQWLEFKFPNRYVYDVLRGLDYMRSAGVAPDERVTEAIEVVRNRRDDIGRWPMGEPHKGYDGEVHFAVDEGPGHPSRWNTLRALRVLRWYDT
jgi:hypothetical protein